MPTARIVCRTFPVTALARSSTFAYATAADDDSVIADRFGEQVLSVTIPTIDERDAVSSIITDQYKNIRVHISPLFGIGSFTGESEETKKVMSLIYVSPYNVDGTPENRELEELMDGIMAREREAWASMDVETRRREIEKEVEKRRATGWSDFGNCLSE